MMLANHIHPLTPEELTVAIALIISVTIILITIIIGAIIVELKKK